MKTTMEYFNFIAKSVIECCTQYYGCEAIGHNLRKREDVNRRRITYVLIKEAIPTASLQDLANLFGKNHATVIYSLRKHNDLVEVDKHYHKDFSEIYSLFFSRYNFKNIDLDRLNFLNSQICKLLEERRKLKNKLKQQGKLVE